MADWRDDRNRGPWPFIPQRNKWGYLNNPRWRPIPRPFVHGGPDDYTGRELEEPQIYTPPRTRRYPVGDSKIHHQCGHWHRGVTLPGAGLGIVIPLEMVGTLLFTDTNNQLYTVTEIEIDPLDYPGVTEARFEIPVVEQILSPSPYFVSLKDEDSDTLITLETTPGLVYDTLSGGFILNSTKKKYYVYTHGTPDATALAFRRAVVILYIPDPTRIRVQIPLVSGDQSSGGGYGDVDLNNYWAWALLSNDSAYGYEFPFGIGDEWFNLFYFDSSKWVTLDHLTFEAIGGVTNEAYASGKQMKAALFNKTTDLMVAGTELTFTDPVPTRKAADFLPDAVNFDDLSEYETRIYLTGGGDGFRFAYLYRSEMYLTVDPLDDCEVHFKTGTVEAGAFGFGVIDTYSSINMQVERFVPRPKIYFESTAKERGGGASLNLMNVQGSGVVVANPTVATIITGPWQNKDGILTPGASISSPSYAHVTLDVPLATAIISASGYDFSMIPPDAIIADVLARTIIGIVNQDASNSLQYVGGPLHTVDIPESEVTINPDPPPASFVNLTGVSYGLGIDRLWTPADLAGIDIRLRVNQPNNAVSTGYLVDWVGLEVALGADIVGLNFSTVNRERQRSGDISGLVFGGNRYTIHFKDVVFGQDIPYHACSFLIFEWSRGA